MKKKVTQKLKVSHSKTNKNNKLTASHAKSSNLKNKPIAKPIVKVDPRFTQAVQNYESGLKAMQAHKFEKAKSFFEKVLEGRSAELADRARLHLNICDHQLAKSSTSFKTPEEHYDYSVSLMNSGDYEGSRSHLEKILKNYPKADYASYGLAVLNCLTGQVEEGLRNLQQAIRLNPSNRFQARNDSDFARMADDPRFTELLYPEPSEEAEESRSPSRQSSNMNPPPKRR